MRWTHDKIPAAMKPWTRHLPVERRNIRLRRWLSASGSLTAHIRHAGHDFRVRRLCQHRMDALPEENAVLARRHGALVREVLLMEGDVPLVFAHSVVCGGDTRGAWQALRGLGSQPLAGLLYADARITRLGMRYRLVTARDALGCRVRHALPQVRFPLWARRSVFRRHGKPLLVTEVFLPAIAALAP